MRFLLRRGGGSSTDLFLRRSCTRSGDGVGVANAKGGSVAVDLKRIVAGMVMLKSEM